MELMLCFAIVTISLKEVELEDAASTRSSCFLARFDWSFCLEVAEHLPSTLTPTFLANLDKMLGLHLVLVVADCVDFRMTQTPRCGIFNVVIIFWVCLTGDHQKDQPSHGLEPQIRAWDLPPVCSTETLWKTKWIPDTGSQIPQERSLYDILW